jgi:hypothetical protein
VQSVTVADVHDRWTWATLSEAARVRSVRLFRELTAIRSTAAERADQPAIRELIADLNAAFPNE